MRRALAIAAAVAMMLAAGEPALAQTPNLPQLQLQLKPQMPPKHRPKIPPPAQNLNRAPNTVLIKPSQAVSIAMRLVPNSKVVGVRFLPGGNYAVTLTRDDRVQRVIIRGDTGEPQ